jgi:hypothetical protein
MYFEGSHLRRWPLLGFPPRLHGTVPYFSLGDAACEAAGHSGLGSPPSPDLM